MKKAIPNEKDGFFINFLCINLELSEQQVNTKTHFIY